MNPTALLHNPLPAPQNGWEELVNLTCEVAAPGGPASDRERAPAPYGVLGDDAVLDAWFGVRSPGPARRALVTGSAFCANGERRHVVGAQVCATPGVAESVAPLVGLHDGVGQDLDHDHRLDLCEGFLRVASAAALGPDLVRERVPAPGQFSVRRRTRPTERR